MGDALERALAVQRDGEEMVALQRLDEGVDVRLLVVDEEDPAAGEVEGVVHVICAIRAWARSYW